MISEPRINTDEHGLEALTFKINGCAMDVLNTIGHGFHEKIYENAMAVAFDDLSIPYSKQHSYPVLYKNKNIGTFVPDFVVNDGIILELKTIDRIGDNEMGQVLNYLRASGLKTGIILNFKHAKLEWKRVAL